MLADPFVLSDHGLTTLAAFTETPWFASLDLVGTAAFAFGGALRARQLRYDHFGAFVLALVSAVGGGTLRDLLVGGARLPPFVLRDSKYVYVVAGVVVLVSIASGRAVSAAAERRIGAWLQAFDAVGIAACTILGANVALLAKLDWFWAPLFAACTCAGGGILREVVCGHEPAVLKGELYEEIAIVGGAAYVGLLHFGAALAMPSTYVAAVTLVVMVAVFAARMWVVSNNLRGATLGGAAV